MTNGSAEFVILEHRTADGIHWDFMLEDTGVLLTWRLTVPPGEIQSGPVQAERIFDHPLRFLTYEGPVQQNTGAVKRVDTGAFRWMEKSETAFTAHLNGTLLRGSYQFSQQGHGPEWIIAHQ